MQRVPMLLYPGFLSVEPKPRRFSCRDASMTVSTNYADNYLMTGDGLCVIPCFGPMMKGLGGWGYADQSELSMLMRQARADPNCKGVMIVADTPGGSVAGTSDLASDIRALDAVKPCMLYAQDLCASAGMWMASSARKVFANETAIVGSIGVRTELMDATAFYEKMGLKITPIVTGAFKAAGDPSQPITPETIAYYQEQIDALGDQFFAAVAQGRNLSVKAIRAMEAKVFVGAAAKEQRLVDDICSLDAAMDVLGKAARKNDKSRMSMAAAALALMDE